MVTVRFTGQVFGSNVRLYEFAYPDGRTERAWSPIWNDWTEEENTERAMWEAERRWNGEKPLWGENWGLTTWQRTR